MRQYYEQDMNLYGVYGYGVEGGDIQLPEKTKQMGAVDGQMRIYIEDYVYTYLYQYGKSNGGREKVAALVGRNLQIDGEEAVVICGAIQGKGTMQQNGVESFTEETWEYIGSQMERYFKGMTLVGWVHVQPGFGSFLMAKDEVFHMEYFQEKWQVLFVLDSLDKIDTFYTHQGEQKGLRQTKGYFVYYDKNREMQEYMLDHSMIRPKEELFDEEEKSVESIPKTEGGRRGRKPKPEERIDAAKEIRRVLQNRAKEVEETQKGKYTMLAAVSCVLCFVCLCMGFGLMSNMTRLKDLESEILMVQNSYEQLEESVEGKVMAAFAAEKTTEVQQPTPIQQPVQQPIQAPVTTGEVRWYTVEAGDSLGYISAKYYGDKSGVNKIMNANALTDANMIYEGQALLIP